LRVRGSVGAAYAGVAAAHGADVDEADIEARFRAAFARMPPLCFPNRQSTDIPALEREWWATLMRKVFLGIDLRDFDACFDDLFDYFADPHSWELFRDARTALESLRARGIRMGIVSNFDGRLTRICAGLGIASFFDTIVMSARVGHAKPDPRIFQIALGSLGVKAAESLHVGDSPAEDVAGAEAAGMRGLLIARESHTPEPGHVGDLRRLVDHL
jgi:putative hydrolase of the HAD superfamily